MKSHGMRSTRFYQTYQGIIARCTRPKNKRWKDYGGRGIKIEWDTFEAFKEDMYASYLEHCERFGEHETTIDRVDTNGNYSKGNCRWANWIEQSRNRTDRKLVEFNGKKLLLTDWCKELGFPLHVLWLRLYRYKWPVEKAFTAPIGPTSKRYK